MLCSSHCISYDQFALKFGLSYYTMTYLSLSSIRINVILDIGNKIVVHPGIKNFVIGAYLTV